MGFAVGFDVGFSVGFGVVSGFGVLSGLGVVSGFGVPASPGFGVPASPGFGVPESTGLLVDVGFTGSVGFTVLPGVGCEPFSRSSNDGSHRSGGVCVAITGAAVGAFVGANDTDPDNNE